MAGPECVSIESLTEGAHSVLTKVKEEKSTLAIEQFRYGVRHMVGGLFLE